MKAFHIKKADDTAKAFLAFEMESFDGSLKLNLFLIHNCYFKWNYFINNNCF